MTTSVNGYPAPEFKQAYKCGVVKPFYGIPTPPFDKGKELSLFSSRINTY
jgi:hypothetical protein